MAYNGKSYTDLKKFGDVFSITKKYSDAIGHEDWQKGFNLFVANQGIENEYSTFWKYVSAVADVEGAEIYSKIKHLNQNIRDIDTCELTHLAGLAYELGYTGSLPQLTFDYPEEINKLLNLFSIDKNILLKTPKVLDIDTRDTIFRQVSGSPEGLNTTYNPYDYSTMTKAGSTITNYLSTQFSVTSALYITDDEKYQTYVDDVFTDVLSTFVNLKYRENELALSGKPIWNELGDQLYDASLFNVTNQKKSPEIEELKSKLGVSSSFVEGLIVDDIQEGKDSFSNYTVSEQRVLELELDRRLNKRTDIKNVSRFSQERERTVKRYFKLVDRINSDQSTAFSTYNADTRFLEVTGGTDLLLQINEDGQFFIDEDLIVRTAKKLRNISFNASYLRQELKRLVRKHNLLGTSQLIKILIKDFMRRHIYSHKLNWRLSNNAKELMSSVELEELSNFDVDVVEYFDTTEYMNISSTGAFYTSTSGLNERYWTAPVSGSQSNEILSGDVINFYRNIVGLDLNTTSNDEYYTELYKFLNQVFNHGAPTQTESTLSLSLSTLVRRAIEQVLQDPSTFYREGPGTNLPTQLGTNAGGGTAGKKPASGFFFHSPSGLNTSQHQAHHLHTGDSGVANPRNRGHRPIDNHDGWFKHGETFKGLDYSSNTFGTNGGNAIITSAVFHKRSSTDNRQTLVSGVLSGGSGGFPTTIQVQQEELTATLISLSGLSGTSDYKTVGNRTYKTHIPATHIHLSTSVSGNDSYKGDLYYFNCFAWVPNVTNKLKLVISGPTPQSTASSGDTSLSAVSAFYSPLVMDTPTTTGEWQEVNGYIWAASGAVTSAYSLFVSGMTSGPMYTDTSPFTGNTSKNHGNDNRFRHNGIALSKPTFSKVLTAGLPAIVETTEIDRGSDAYYKYTGSQSGDLPYANFKNTNTATFAPHPFINNIVEKKVRGYDLVNDSIDYESESSSTAYLTGNIVQQITVSGATVDSWRKANIENTGYQTKYEQDTNLNTLSIVNSGTDIDGPFNYNALNTFINAANSNAWFTANSAHFYGHLDLTDSELTRIKTQLNTYRNNILSLSGKVLYKYTTDQYQNHYMLYKDENEFENTGELFLRKNDHPLPIPAVDVSSNINNSDANLNINGHSQLSNNADRIYDIGFTIDTLYLIVDNTFDSKVVVGTVSQEFNSVGQYNEIKFIRNPSHKVELIQVPAGNKIAGINVIDGIINIVSVTSSTSIGLSASNNNVVNVLQQCFDPDNLGLFVEQTDSVSVPYNEADPTRNTFKTSFTNDILSIGFESERPSGYLQNYVGATTSGFASEGAIDSIELFEDTFVPKVSFFGDTSPSTLSHKGYTIGYGQTANTSGAFDLSGTSLYKTPNNGITVVDFELLGESFAKGVYRNPSEVYDITNTAGQDSIHHFYPVGDLAHFISFPGQAGNMKFWRNRGTALPSVAMSANDIYANPYRTDRAVTHSLSRSLTAGTGISHSTDHSTLDLRYMSPSAINIQVLKSSKGNTRTLSANTFQITSGVTVSATRGMDLFQTAGGLTIDNIRLTSDHFDFRFYESNGINSRGYKLRTNLFVRDEVSTNGKLTPDDLSWGEFGEIITYEQDEFADRDYFLMTDYTYSVTDFKKMKIKVTAELPNWSEENKYESPGSTAGGSY